VSAKGTPSGSGAGLGDGPNTRLGSLMVMLTGLVLVRVYVRYALVIHLRSLIVDPLVVVGLSSALSFESLYLSTNL